MVNDDISPEQVSTAIMTVTKGPMISFFDEDLALVESRSLPLCLTIVINNTLVDSTLVDTGASINVCPISTLRMTNVSEKEIEPATTSVVAYDSSKRAVHGKIMLRVGLGPLSMSILFFVIDIDPTFKAILGHPWIELV